MSDLEERLEEIAAAAARALEALLAAVGEGDHSQAVTEAVRALTPSAEEASAEQAPPGASPPADAPPATPEPPAEQADPTGEQPA